MSDEIAKSNVEGMKRSSARDFVPSKQVKKAWRKTRNYKVKKDNDGNIVSRNMSPGLSLKEWARKEASRLDRRPEDTAAVAWLKRKATKQVKVKKPPLTFKKKSQ